MSAAPQGTSADDSRPPRGALVVIAIGLVACLVAALASTGKGEGEAATLEWVQSAKGPDSGAVPVPGGTGSMRLTDTNIRATGTNVSGYSLYIVSTVFTVSAGAPIADSSALCAIKAPKGTEVAQSGGDLRATYPRSSEEGIYGQEVPEAVRMDFSSHGGELAELEVPDRPQRFTTEQGVKVEWPEFKIGEERIEYMIAGKPKEDLALPFFTIWRTTDVPSAKFRCTLKTRSGEEATVATHAALAERSPPIDEEAEELKTEEREEAEEEEKGDEG